MSTTSNVIAGATLTAALIGGALLLDPGDATVAQNATVASDGGVVDAGQQPLVGAFYLRFQDQAAWEAAAKNAGLWRPIMRREQFCDRWGKEYVEVEDAGFLDMVAVDAGCISHGTRLVPADAGEVDLAASDHAIDIVGTISRPLPGDAGVETLDGYHVNFQGVLPQAWEQYLVQPENPVRTWAR